MSRASLLALALLVIACGSKSKGPELAPLPDDKPPADTAAAEKPPGGDVGPDGRPVKDIVQPVKIEKIEPVSITLPASDVTVKLLTRGKGKRTPLRYAPKAGTKQQVELSFDVAIKQAMGADAQEDIVPTVVLAGESEIKAVDAAGKAEYAFDVATADARAQAGAQVPIDKFKRALASLSSLVIGGSVDAMGAMGDITLQVDVPDELTRSALEVVVMALPTWPALPKEPIGVGAKWEATKKARIGDKVDVTQVTTYELVSRTGDAWTVKGTTKVSGTEHQTPEGAKVEKIAGSGTSQVALAAGALFPTSTSTLENGFTLSDKGQSLTISVKVASGVTAK